MLSKTTFNVSMSSTVSFTSLLNDSKIIYADPKIYEAVDVVIK
jgi:hypothetical protein